MAAGCDASFQMLKARLRQFPPAARVTVAPVTGGGSRSQASRAGKEESQAGSLLLTLFSVETDTIESFCLFQGLVGGGAET